MASSPGVRRSPRLVGVPSPSYKPIGSRKAHVPEMPALTLGHEEKQDKPYKGAKGVKRALKADTPDTATGKKKKDKKKKRKIAEEDAVATTPPATAAVETKTETAEERKKRKEQKRAKKEALRLEAEAAVAAAAAAAAAVAAVSSGEKKKKNKKKKTDDAEASASTVPAEADASEPQTKKSKKGKSQNHSEHKTAAVPAPDEKGGICNLYREHPEVTELSDAVVQGIRQADELTVTAAKGADPVPKPITSFDHLRPSLGKNADSVLTSCKDYTTPTPIQKQAWPVQLSGRDVIAIAKTGSGKTMGFTLPALAQMLYQMQTYKRSAKKGPLMLVLAPTRELAQQSAEVAEQAGKGCGIKTACVYGGAGSHNAQRSLLRACPHVLVATPGRLLSFVRDGTVSLGNVLSLVLDEADRMLDMGFEPDVREIIGNCPTHPFRQTALFSATWPTSIQRLAAEFVTSPVHVTIGSTDSLTANQDVQQIVEVIDDYARLRRLEELLKKYHSSKKNRVLVFVLYKKEAARIERELNNRGWPCVSIHGDKSQTDRNAALEGFRSGRSPLLVATDVAARGLDIPEVSHVLNYSFPLTVEDYVHRIGRTGRAGRKGISHTFFVAKDNKHLGGELVALLRDANQTVPEELLEHATFTKKKEHPLYGAHFRADDGRPMKKATRIKFT